jgi:hypothetical protein
LAESLSPEFIRFDQGLVAGFTAEECTVLERLLDRVYSNVLPQHSNAIAPKPFTTEQKSAGRRSQKAR